MHVLDRRLTLAALAPFPVMLLVARLVGARSGPLFRRYQADLGALNEAAEEQPVASRSSSSSTSRNSMAA